MVLLLTTTSLASLEVNNIDTDSGFAEINLDKTDLVTQTSIIIHIINPDEIINVLNTITDKLENLGLERKTILQTEVNHLINKIKTITPKTKRIKRGLVNAIGMTSKWLFGTLDEQDRLDIEEHFKILEYNQNNLINNANEQIKINHQFNKTFYNLKTVIENDRTIIENHINKISEPILQQNLYNDLLFKIQLVKEKIDTIQNNLASARHGIVHPNILTNEEIENYEIDFYKLQYIKLGVAKFEKSSLLFAIKIPRKVKQIQLKIIIPLPNKLGKEIDFIQETVFEYNNLTYQYKPFKTLNELEISKHCIFKQNCKLINNNLTEIIQIDEETIIIKNANNNILNQSCDKRNISLFGNILIHFNNCTLNIIDHYFSNLKDVIYERFYYPNKQKFENFQNKITFDDIIIKNQINEKNINKLYYQKNMAYGLTTVIIFIILAIVTIKVFAFKKLFKDKNIVKRIQENSKSNEGEVTYTPPIITCKSNADIASAFPVYKTVGTISFPTK